MESSQTEYRLRNDRTQVFSLQATARCLTQGVASIRAVITPPAGAPFRCEILFEGEFTASKPRFTEAMYLGAGISILHGQIESHHHQDTRIRVHRASGLMDSEPGARLGWTDPAEPGPGPA